MEYIFYNWLSLLVYITNLNSKSYFIICIFFEYITLNIIQE